MNQEALQNAAAASDPDAMGLVHSPSASGKWSHGVVPANVRVGRGTLITGALAFKRFHSREAEALVIGSRCTMDGVQFNIGVGAKVAIGDCCYFTNSVVLCELELQIGSYVVVGWNATISDTDFHPLDPARRIADAIALSPLGQGKPRPPIEARPITVEDGVWIGHNATVLKGVRIGTGAWIEPGSLITKDVPPHARVLGNPASIIGRAP
jgi:acetyltransferase-like isoleucine patch superfamily enzyme